MHKIALALLALLFALVPTEAQVPGFPQTLPANTVVGRLGISPGPSQAIPFATLATAMNLPVVTAAVVCDGTTNDVTAINNAITQASGLGGGIVQLPARTCAVGGTNINMLSNVCLRGGGMGKTVLKLNALHSSYVIIANTKTFVCVTDLTIDAGDFDGGASSGAILLQAVTDSAVERVEVKNMGRFGIIYQGATRLWLNDNVVEKTTPATSQNQAILGTCSLQNSYVTMRGNKLRGSGIDQCDSFSTYIDNYVTGWRFGAGFTAEQSTFCHDNAYIGNIAESGGGNPDANGYVGAAIENWCPRTIIKGNISRSNQGAGFDIGGKNNIVVGNIASDNNQIALNGDGFVCRYADATYNCSGSLFADNIATGATHRYGYAEENALITGVIVGVNSFTGATAATSLLSSTFSIARLNTALNLAGGVTGATPQAQLSFTAYTDNAGAVSPSHIDLLSGVYGFGISGGQLNYITNTAAIHAFYTGASLTTPIVTIGAGGITSSRGTTGAIATITYSASMTPDAALGDVQVITATNGTAFTINAPTNPATGMTRRFTIRNTSGGALGVITWNAVFKMPAFTSPATANSRTVQFHYDGTNWIQEFQSAADVPN